MIRAPFVLCKNPTRTKPQKKEYTMKFNLFHKPTMTETALNNVRKMAKPVMKAVKKNMKHMKGSSLVASGIALGVTAAAATAYQLVKRHG